ncbi:MAG: 50S ribosomal protein L6, partial [Candidatus Hermodarchaeota archaeon]
ICYSHFPCTVEVNTDKKEIHVVNFLGERAPRVTNYLENVEVKVEGDDVFLIGPDKETLGQTAANLRKACRIRKKDPRVFQDGVYLYRIQNGEEITWEVK